MKTALMATAMIALWGVQRVNASENYDLLGHKTLAAFECAIYAEMAGDAQQRDRLMALGIQDGKEVLIAIHSGAVTKAGENKEIPEIFGIIMDRYKNQSDDFVLGRLFEKMSNVADAIFSNGLPGSLVEYRKRADDAFDSKNCRLL